MKFFLIFFYLLKTLYSQSVSLGSTNSDFKLYPLDENHVYAIDFEQNRIQKIDFINKSANEVISFLENEIIAASSSPSNNLYVLCSFKPYLIYINKLANYDIINVPNLERFQFQDISINALNQLFLLSENNHFYSLDLNNLELNVISKDSELFQADIVSVEAIKTNGLKIELYNQNYVYDFSLNGIFIKKEKRGSKKIIRRNKNTFRLNRFNQLFKNKVLLKSDVIDFTIFNNSIFILLEQNEVQRIKSE